MRRSAHFTFLFCFLFTTARAQMWNGTDTLYGNEWIRYDQQYYKILVAEDGIYRIPYETLQSSGLPVSSIDGSQYQLWHLGEEQPLYVSTAGPLAPGAFIEFYGQKNRSELDRYLFRDPDNELLNPWYSLFTDTSAYFLTWVESGAATLRYEEVENELTNLPGREEWVWEEEEILFSDQVSKRYIGVTSTLYIYYSRFEDEGFTSSSEISRTFSVPCPGVYAGGPLAELELRLLSNNNFDTSVVLSHSLEIHVDGELLVEEQFSGVILKRFRFERPSADLV